MLLIELYSRLALPPPANVHLLENVCLNNQVTCQHRPKFSWYIVERGNKANYPLNSVVAKQSKLMLSGKGNQKQCFNFSQLID